MKKLSLFHTLMALLMPAFCFLRLSVAPDGVGDTTPGDQAPGDPAPDDTASGDPAPTISDAEAKLLKEVMEKKNKLKAAEAKAAELEANLKRFEGIDPDAVRTLLQAQKDEETKKLEAKGEFDRVKTQMVEEHSRETAALKQLITNAQNDSTLLRAQIAELTVGNAFGSSPFIRDELALTVNKTRQVYGSHFEFADGQIVGYDKPVGAKDRTVLVDGKGDPLNFDLALKKIVDADPDREQLLRSRAKPGAGSNTSSTGRTKGVEGAGDSLVGRGKIAAALSKGILSQ